MIVWLLGSHVKHVGVAVRKRAASVRWVPLCAPVAVEPDKTWRIANTPQQNSRRPCKHCRRRAGRILASIDE